MRPFVPRWCRFSAALAAAVASAAVAVATVAAATAAVTSAVTAAVPFASLHVLVQRLALSLFCYFPPFAVGTAVATVAKLPKTFSSCAFVTTGGPTEKKGQNKKRAEVKHTKLEREEKQKVPPRSPLPPSSSPPPPPPPLSLPPPP